MEELILEQMIDKRTTLIYKINRKGQGQVTCTIQGGDYE